MKNIAVAINEGTNKVRHYVAIEADIATGKCLAYNPETGVTVITPYKDRNAYWTKYLNEHPYKWMEEFNPNEIEITENWMHN